MAVTALTGHGDPDVLALLPGTVPADRVALAGLHARTDGTSGPRRVGVDTRSVPTTSRLPAPLLDWLAGTGCFKLAVHFDVDTVDSEEMVLALGAEAGALTINQARRLVADLKATYDVGLAIP